MSIYILFWLAAGGAALDHIDETFHGFKVHIPSNDDGSGGHVASEGTEKSRSRFSHKFRWCLDNWFMYQENDFEEGKCEVGPFSSASPNFQQSLLVRRNQSYTTSIFTHG